LSEIKSFEALLWWIGQPNNTRAIRHSKDFQKILFQEKPLIKVLQNFSAHSGECNPTEFFLYVIFKHNE
jgi:hypothetical protein